MSVRCEDCGLEVACTREGWHWVMPEGWAYRHEAAVGGGLIRTRRMFVCPSCQEEEANG